jgi:hypothetical protein
MRAVRLARSLAACSLLLSACGPTAPVDDDGDGVDASGGGPDADEPRPDARPWTPSIDADTGCSKMDLLFVVDNSGSMGEEQANLATNFPAFIDVIAASGLDWRVGVTTTGVDYTYLQNIGFGTLPQSVTGGDNGELLQPSGCGMTKRWIDSTDVDPAATFACVANVGTSGPSDEMPLAATRAALDDRMSDGTNSAWRRPDALLGIVLLTDENDCSYETSVTLGFTEVLCDSQQEPVANYVSFLDGYTGDRGRWATAVIAGTGPSGCTSDLGDADYAQRLDQFVQLAGSGNGVFSSICAGDLTAGLQAALALFDSACQSFPPID